MSNPMAGSDYTVNMTAKDEDGELIDLTGATVTVEYKTPNNQLTEGVAPTNVDIPTSVITYKIQDTIAVQGSWEVGAKVITASGDIRFVNPRVGIFFDRR